MEISQLLASPCLAEHMLDVASISASQSVVVLRRIAMETYIRQRQLIMSPLITSHVIGENEPLTSVFNKVIAAKEVNHKGQGTAVRREADGKTWCGERFPLLTKESPEINAYWRLLPTLSQTYGLCNDCHPSTLGVKMIKNELFLLR